MDSPTVEEQTPLSASKEPEPEQQTEQQAEQSNEQTSILATDDTKEQEEGEEQTSVPTAEERIQKLERRVAALTSLLTILWETAGPNASFRCYFTKERFANEQELTDHLQALVPSVGGVTAAKHADGKLEGWAFFTCDNALEAERLGSVRWGREQHDVILS